MNKEHRDTEGRLKVPYFSKLINDYRGENGTYVAKKFKQYVINLRILAPQDFELEKNGYPIWKHRIDRAAQKVFTGI
jgi:hypothetical protein